jgi:hypothetical protein
MIAKILKATSNFSGILYSELKINEGKASFCGAYNFPFDEKDASVDDYVNYLAKYAEAAKRDIKNIQFHATISTKGKEHDKEFLTDIAQKWMQKMGYGEQPYLIYFHGDTDNNHVHIVSCRINAQGQRINPYMEGRRAGTFICELMNENFAEKAKADISDVMNNYNFSTTAQFRLALECRGWITTEKDGHINLIKAFKQDSISTASVSAKAQTYQPNDVRKKQLRAIINRYKGLPTEQLQKFMRDNFGIDIVFHKAKNHTQPYGYTLIDYTAKHIFKGSEIMPLQAIINPVSRAEHTRLVNEILNTYVYNSNALYSDLKKMLNRNGYKIDKHNIFIAGDDTPLLRLSDNLYKQLRYNDRLKQANRFIAKNSNETVALARIFFVRSRDIRLQPDVLRDDSALRETISFLVNDRDALNDWLKERKMALVSLTNNTYIINAHNRTLADVSGLGIETGLDLERYNHVYGNDYDAIPENSAIGMLVGLFDAITAGIVTIGGEEHDELDMMHKRKKKRQMLL